jgi:hypothetical protein
VKNRDGRGGRGFGTNASAGMSLPHDLGDTPLPRSTRRSYGTESVPFGATGAVRAQEIAAQNSPTERGRRLRARFYALDSEQASALRLMPEFAGEELHDPEISRLIGIYRAKLPRVLKFAA